MFFLSNSNVGLSCLNLPVAVVFVQQLVVGLPLCTPLQKNKELSLFLARSCGTHCAWPIAGVWLSFREHRAVL